MGRLVTFAAMWLVAAAVATTAAWQGVTIVTSQVTDDRPAAIGAADVQAALEAADPTVPSTAAPADTGPGGSAGSPGATGSGTTSTTAADAGVTKTYNLVGGTAALRFSPSGVTVLWSRPKPGFSRESEPENGNGVRVEFESESHRSRIDGWWDDGPQERRREESR